MKHNNKYHPVAHAVKYAIATTFALGVVSGAVVAQEASDTATKEQKIDRKTKKIGIENLSSTIEKKKFRGIFFWSFFEPAARAFQTICGPVAGMN